MHSSVELEMLGRSASYFFAAMKANMLSYEVGNEGQICIILVAAMQPSAYCHVVVNGG